MQSKPKTNKIALCHSHLQLRLTQNNNDEFTAELLDKSGGNSHKNPYTVASAAAYALAGKERFAGQLRCRGYSVLHHCFLAYATAKQFNFSNDVVRQCLLHDIGEAFFVDIATPHKIGIDRAREEAIVKELTEVLGFNIELHNPEVGKIDSMCAVIEAYTFGWDWQWPLQDISTYYRDELDMLTFMRDYIKKFAHSTDEPLLYNVNYNETTNLIKTYPSILQELGVL